jgi:RNA polymerase sigma-70 factor, ECF subfamily
MGDMIETDIRLLKAAKSGNESAFLALYHRFRTPLFRFAWRLTHSIQAAEDVIQECFLVLIEGASFDANRGSLRAYLFGITRNLALKRVRLVEREIEEVEEDANTTPGPLEDLLSAERCEVVARAVSTLPLRQREALIMFEYEGLSLEEIAEATGSEVGAVKARLHRARETLRLRLVPLMGAHAVRREL